jgi:hypothetical protein
VTPAQLALGFGYDRADFDTEVERFGLPDGALGWSVTGRAARPAPVPPVSVSAAADRVAARRRLDATSVWLEPETQILPVVSRVDVPTVVLPGVLLPRLDVPEVRVPRHRRDRIRSHRRTRGGAR